MLSNEMIFYGGLATMGIGCALLLVFIAAHIISGIKLNVRFDEEYGKKVRK